jgi:hypothetical protein
MPIYGNAANSSIASYEITSDGLAVTFHKGRTYEYTEGYNDSSTIQIMIELAQNGSGLNRFINLEKPTYS